MIYYGKTLSSSGPKLTAVHGLGGTALGIGQHGLFSGVRAVPGY